MAAELPMPPEKCSPLAPRCSRPQYVACALLACQANRPCTRLAQARRADHHHRAQERHRWIEDIVDTGLLRCVFSWCVPACARLFLPARTPVGFHELTRSTRGFFASATPMAKAASTIIAIAYAVRGAILRTQREQ